MWSAISFFLEIVPFFSQMTLFLSLDVKNVFVWMLLAKHLGYNG